MFGTAIHKKVNEWSSDFQQMDVKHASIYIDLLRPILIFPIIHLFMLNSISQGNNYSSGVIYESINVEKELNNTLPTSQ